MNYQPAADLLSPKKIYVNKRVEGPESFLNHVNFFRMKYALKSPKEERYIKYE